MLKGISRQILEVSQPENPYFERAFLIVRPSCCELPPPTLTDEAHRFLNQQSPHSGLKRARRFTLFRRLGWLLLGSAIGAMGMWVISVFF